MTNALLRRTVLPFALLASMGAMTGTAQATTYGECVSATWDVIGCALNPDYEEWGGMTVNFEGEPDGESVAMAEAMIQKGVFKPYAELGEAIVAGKLSTTCTPRDLLAIVDKAGRDTKMVAEACYKPAK